MAGSGFRTEAARTAYSAVYDAALAASAVPVEQFDLHGPYGTTHVVVAGNPDAPPLVALHGKNLSATGWISMLPVLAANHRVYLLDTVGDLNKSRAVRSLRRKADALDWLVGTFDALRVDRPVVAGMSQGGWFAALLATHRPERVRSLVLLCPAGVFVRLSPAWLFRAMRAMAVRPTRSSIDGFIRTLIEPSSTSRLEQPPWSSVFEQWRIGVPSFRPSLTDRLPTPLRAAELARVTVPALVMYGDHETICDGPTAVTRATRAWPHAQVELVAGANHALNFDQPDVVDRLVAGFLAATS